MMPRFILLAFAFLAAAVSSSAQQFNLPITITDGTGTQNVILGVDPSGTDGFDAGLDIYAPPAPPSGLYAVSNVASDNHSSDYRASVGPHTFNLAVSGAAAGSTVTYSWDSTGLSELGSFTITDALGGIVLSSTDMTGTTSVSLPQAAPSVVITITPLVNEVPAANDDDVTVTEDTPKTFSPLANDTDGNGDTLTLSNLSTPSKGTVTNDNGTLTYTPNANETGADSFTYDVSDGNGGSDTGTVNITITPVNDAPTLPDADLFEGVQAGGSLVIGAAQNDNSVTRDDYVYFRWAEASDVEDDAIKYTFVMATDSSLQDVFYERETALRVDSLTIETMAGFMGESAEASVWLGLTASDASESTTVSVPLTLVRGFIVSTEDGELPTEFALHGNYPNPFNPQTTIRYDVAEAGMVEIVVLDMLGRRIATLAEGQHKPGSFEVRFDASNMPSGTYLYVMRTASYQSTKTMVLVR